MMKEFIDDVKRMNNQSEQEVIQSLKEKYSAEKIIAMTIALIGIAYLLKIIFFAISVVIVKLIVGIFVPITWSASILINIGLVIVGKILDKIKEK